MTTIHISEVIGEVAVAASDGDRVAGIARDALARGHDVLLDFAGVEIIVTSFLNRAIGSLLETFELEQVRGRVRYAGADTALKERIDLVAANAARYYRDDAYRAAVDESLHA